MAGRFTAQLQTPAEEIAARWQSTIKWREVNKGCLMLGENENQGQYSRNDRLHVMHNKSEVRFSRRNVRCKRRPWD